MRGCIVAPLHPRSTLRFLHFLISSRQLCSQQVCRYTRPRRSYPLWALVKQGRFWTFRTYHELQHPDYSSCGTMIVNATAVPESWLCYSKNRHWETSDMCSMELSKLFLGGPGSLQVCQDCKLGVVISTRIMSSRVVYIMSRRYWWRQRCYAKGPSIMLWILTLMEYNMGWGIVSVGARWFQLYKRCHRDNSITIYVFQAGSCDISQLLLTFEETSWCCMLKIYRIIIWALVS